MIYPRVKRGRPYDMEHMFGSHAYNAWEVHMNFVTSLYAQKEVIWIYPYYFVRPQHEPFKYTSKVRAEIERKARQVDNLTNRSDRTERKKFLTEAAYLHSGLSLALWPSFLEKLTSSSTTFISPDKYSICSFQPLHILHLGLSVLLKCSSMTYLTSPAIISHLKGRNREQKRFKALRTPLLRTWNPMQASIEKKYPVPALHIYFSKKEPSSVSNRLFMKYFLRLMLQWKDSC